MAQKRKKQKKWMSWLVLMVLFLVAGVVVYLVWDSYFKDKKEGDDESRTEQVEERSEDKDDNVQEEVEIIEKPKVEQYEGNDPNEAEALSGVMTYAGVNGDKLMVRVNIDQYLDSGECDLSIERNGMVVYSDVASVVGNVSTATCEGFDVAVGELGNGSVSIIVGIRSGDKTGTINGEADL